MIKRLLDKINEKWYYIFADLFNKASIYILTFVFSYIVLPDSFGRLSLFNSLVTVFFVFVSLNFTSSYITKKRLEPKCNFTEILSTIITFIFIVNVIFIVFATLIWLFKINIYSVGYVIIICSIITAILNCNYELLLTILVTEKEKKHYLIISVLFSILLIALSFLLFFCFKNLNVYAIIFAKMILLLSFSLYSIIYMKRKYNFHLHINKIVLKDALRFSVPLMLHSLSGFILNYVDKFMLNDMENLTSTAIYSFS